MSDKTSNLQPGSIAYATAGQAIRLPDPNSISPLSLHDASLIATKLQDRQLIDNRNEFLRVLEALNDLAKGVRHKSRGCDAINYAPRLTALVYSSERRVEDGPCDPDCAEKVLRTVANGKFSAYIPHTGEGSPTVSIWVNGFGRAHRDEDLPAIIYHEAGHAVWMRDGQRHRDGDRPACNVDPCVFHHGKLIRIWDAPGRLMTIEQAQKS